MAYILGSVTLKKPVQIDRRQVIIGSDNTTLQGITKRDITRLKEIFILTFQHLTQSQVSDIVGEFETKQPRTFSVTDGNLTISARSVLIRITSREYVKGNEFRENMTLELTEV